MEQLTFIEQIAFESGSTLKVEQLPPQLKAEVERYNSWTARASRLQEDLNNLQDQLQVIVYARQAAFNNIQQLAQTFEVASNEASASTNDSETCGADPQDPQ